MINWIVDQNSRMTAVEKSIPIMIYMDKCIQMYQIRSPPFFKKKSISEDLFEDC